jgi:hypothetical protein
LAKLLKFRRKRRISVVIPEGDMARLVGQASRLFRFQDIDERISVENAVTVALARKRNLGS